MREAAASTQGVAPARCGGQQRAGAASRPSGGPAARCGGQQGGLLGGEEGEEEAQAAGGVFCGEERRGKQRGRGERDKK